MIGKPIKLRVSLNGKFIDKKPVDFFFYSEPTINKLVPLYGPIGGGYFITIQGLNFVNMSKFPNEFVCVYKLIGNNNKKEITKTEAIFVNPQEIKCKTPLIYKAGYKIMVKINIFGKYHKFNKDWCFIYKWRKKLFFTKFIYLL